MRITGRTTDRKVWYIIVPTTSGDRILRSLSPVTLSSTLDNEDIFLDERMCRDELKKASEIFSMSRISHTFVII